MPAPPVPERGFVREPLPGHRYKVKLAYPEFPSGIASTRSAAERAGARPAQRLGSSR